MTYVKLQEIGVQEVKKKKNTTPKTNGGEKGHSEKWTEKLKEQFRCPFLRKVLPDHLLRPLPDWVNLVLPGCPGSLVAKSCLTLVTPGTVARQAFSVHGILQARILEWVAVSSSRGSSLPDPGIVLGRKPVKPKVPQIHHSSCGCALGNSSDAFGFSSSQADAVLGVALHGPHPTREGP